MASIIAYSDLDSIESSAGELFFRGGGDVFRLIGDRCTGLGGAPPRVEIVDRPGGDGGIPLSAGFKGPRPLTLSGFLHIVSETVEADFHAARQALGELAIEVFEACTVAAPGTLKGTPPGGGQITLEVITVVELKFGAGTAFDKPGIVSITAPDPDWA